MVPQFLRLSNRAIQFFETNFYPAGSTIFDGPDLEFDKCAVIVAGLAKALQGACATAGGAGRNGGEGGRQYAVGAVLGVEAIGAARYFRSKEEIRLRDSVKKTGRPYGRPDDVW